MPNSLGQRKLHDFEKCLDHPWIELLAAFPFVLQGTARRHIMPGVMSGSSHVLFVSRGGGLSMSAADVVREGLAATEAGDFGKLESLVADDFAMTGPVPMPVGKREFIGLMMAMLKAMPDWRFNPGEFQENGDQVTVPLQITGTQTGELQLPMPGMPAIPASGKKVSLPSEPSTFTVKNGKLAKLEVESTPTGGVTGILSQLGVNLPGM